LLRRARGRSKTEGKRQGGLNRVRWLLGLGFVAGAVGLLAAASLASADEEVNVDFENLTPGQFVISVTTDPNGGASTTSGNAVPGSIAVNGQGGSLPGEPNTAIIFDSSCAGGPDPSTCTGGDSDLYQQAQGNVLIVAENVAGGDDGVVDDPDDDAAGGALNFDFSGFGFGLGEVTVVSITVLDAGDGGEVSAGSFVFQTSAGEVVVPIDAVADGGINVQALNVAGVTSFRVVFSGSGAADDLRLLVQEPTLEPTLEPTVPPTPRPRNTVEATATPEDDIAPTATITATVTPTNSPTATAEPVEDEPPPTQVVVLAVSPEPTATATPTATPSPTATPVPAPTSIPPAVAPVAEVLGLVIQPEAPNFLADFSGLGDFSTNLGVVATNITLALITLLLILVATTVFNATIKENAEAISLNVTQLALPVTGIASAIGSRAAPFRSRHAQTYSVAKLIGLLSLTAIIYATLDPHFGFNDASLVLILGLMAGLTMTTFLFEGGQVLFSSKAFGAPAAIRAYPIALAIATVSVVLSRVVDLNPGVIFGFVAAAAMARGHLGRREEGLIVFVPMLGVLGVSLIALALIDPMREFGNNHPGVWYSLPETIAVAIFVGGAESVLLSMIPLTFNDGEKVWAWNRYAWAAVALPASFLFFHVILNRDGSYESLSGGTKGPLIAAVIFLIVSLIIWLYFRLRNGDETAEPEG
jgi:hypothetical protein